MSTHETIQIVHLSLLSIYLNHKYIQCKRKLLYVHLNRYVGWIISADCWCAINFRVYLRSLRASSPRAPPPWKTKREKEKKNWKGLTAFSVISALFKTVKLTYFKSDQLQLRLAPKKPTPPPPGTIFFSLGWQIRGAGDSWAVKSFGGGGGRKKRANRQQSVSSATFFIVCTVE